MGGLVARAAVHPDIGKLHDQVLGVVHGVMPAMGAGTAYKRMRCGFEGSGISPRILGYIGSHVTAVLANSQGGLELLPSQAYGNHWLKVEQKGKILKSLPENGDPYEEIYKVHDRWFGLLREDWLNPANQNPGGFRYTCKLLDNAKAFHSAISEHYHSNSYAHYGADLARTAWHRVIWEVNSDEKLENAELLSIASDNAKGSIYLTLPGHSEKKENPTRQYKITMKDAADPGDQTVPLHSADAQFRSKKFKGIFCQTGYEHQASYSNRSVLNATLYCLFQIASTMKWSE
jgi:hypothetical protein